MSRRRTSGESSHLIDIGQLDPSFYEEAPYEAQVSGLVRAAESAADNDNPGNNAANS